MNEEIVKLENEIEVHIEKIKEIRLKITELRKDCKHEFEPNLDGWFADVFRCKLCGYPIRK